jgi:hypothetical protein
MDARRVLILSCALVAACCVSGAALAGGGQHYPNGAEGCFCGVAPPPGWYVIDYFLYYSADSYKDDAGNTVTAGMFADFDATIWADVVRVLYSSEVELLGGTWMAHIFVPYLNTDLKSVGFDDSGLGDVIIDPFIIAWHWGTYHAVAGIDFYAPTGDYERGNPASVGKNFWTIEPVVAAGAMFDNGITASVKLMYDFNLKNDDWLNPVTATVGELEPGQELHFDYAVDYAVTPAWHVGLAGYYYQQITDDEFDGAKMEDQRGRVLDFGPEVRFQHMFPNDGMLAVEARYFWETQVENRPEGGGFWLKVMYGF